jgi:membrane protein YqaA with SNARE-associated domain
MKSLSTWILGFVASPIGVAVLAALDSTIFVSIPGGLDAVVVLLASRGAAWVWLTPSLALVGSMAGAAFTFWMGARLGELGLERYIASKRLEKIRRRVREPGAIGFAVLDLIPPPFPFTPFILAAGGLEVEAPKFFITLTFCRVIRFGAEAALAATYGRRIATWFESDIFHRAVILYVVLAVALTVFTLIKALTPSSRTKRSAAA